MRILTTLERKILITRIKNSIMWLLLIFAYSFFFTIHWLLGFIWIFSLPIAVYIFYRENLYYPHHSYFRAFRKASKEKRLEISTQSELTGKYLHLGEVVFLEEYIVFTKFGVVLPYKSFQSISQERQKAGRDSSANDFFYLITIKAEDGKSYRFRVWNTDRPFICSDSMYSQVVAWCFSKRNNLVNTEDDFV